MTQLGVLFAAALAPLAVAQVPAAPPPLTLQGRVTDVLGDPIPAALIEVHRAVDEVAIARTMSDGEGLWQIARLPGGEALVVEATSPGKVPRRRADLASADGDALACNFELADGVPLRGVVSCAGLPVEGAAVVVRAPGLRTALRTDANGRYEVAAVPPLGVNVSAFHGCRVGTPVEVDGRGKPEIVEDFELVGAKGNPRLLIAVDVPAAVRRASWFEVRPDDGLRVPDLVRLPLRADGTCEVERLPFAHEVVLHVLGHVAVPPFERCGAFDREDLEFRVAPAAVVAATIARGVVTKRGGGPVAGAKVTVRDREGKWLAAAETAADGSFAAEVARPRGTLLGVRARAPDGGAAQTTATLGFDPIGIDVVDTTAVAGRLVGRDGSALAFTEVDVVVYEAHPSRVEQLKFQAFTVTDRDGSIVVRGLPPGRCEVTVRDAAGNLGVATVPIAPGANAALPALEYAAGAGFTGRVVDGAGRPLPGVAVHADPQSRGRTAQGWQFAGAVVQTDRNGNYRIRGLRPDTYRLRVVGADQKQMVEVEAAAAAGSFATVNLIAQ